MPRSEFWEGPPHLARVYREAFRYKEERLNAEQWRLGQYMVSAIAATVGNMMKRKGAKPIDYLKEPLPLTEEEVERRRVRDAEELERKITERMNRLVANQTVHKK